MLGANDVKLLVEMWLDICQFAKWIIEDSSLSPDFDELVAKKILEDIDSTIKDAKNKFQITLE